MLRAAFPRESLRVARLVVGGLAGLLASAALASPLVQLETAADFQAAINAGNLVPQLSNSADLQAHYPGDTFAPSDIFAFQGLAEDPDGGMVMAWGDNQDVNYYAAWRYVYDLDPSLTGLTISATVIPPGMLGPPPGGVTSVSLAIFDNTGAFRSWTWDVAPFGNGTLPPNVPTTISVLITPQGQGGPGDAVPFADSFIDTGVNPNAITQFGWDENGNWVNMTQVVPGTNQLKPWNYWSNVTVTPEPGAAGIVLLGGLLLLRRRLLI